MHVVAHDSANRTAFCKPVREFIPDRLFAFYGRWQMPQTALDVDPIVWTGARRLLAEYGVLARCDLPGRSGSETAGGQRSRAAEPYRSGAEIYWHQATTITQGKRYETITGYSDTMGTCSREAAPGRRRRAL